ncbi:MAG: D-aminoacylase [Opitutae bacterium]|nr:D-aminoacylase [Opitutae bacterium]
MRLSAILLSLALFNLSAAAEEYDLVIRHARLIDGDGHPAETGDLAVRDGHIAAIGQFEGRGRTEIDAAGRVLAPGFIDVHTHSEDIAELPNAENFIRMGVTTIITGNCGTSRLDMGEFFAELTKTKVAVNVASLIGHNTVRFQVMGGSFARPPTAAELAEMRRLVDRAMQDGALGLSTGLIYLPGSFARTEELIELARASAARGGIYTSHMRYENYRIREALDEVVRIAHEAKTRAHVSHLKLAGPAAWGQAADILAYLDHARAEGLAISEDQYVYTASSTSLGAQILNDAREGGTERFRERLADPVWKKRIVDDMKQSLQKNRRPDFSFAVIANFKPDPRLNGKTVPEAAQLLRGAATIDDQIETILDVEARGGAQAVFHGMSEADLQKFLQHPATMIASDSGPRKFGEAVPHPRGYGNNARVLGHYVRDLRLLTLEEAVRRMTSLPARTFHLAQRGELKTGYVADLVIFDPATVNDPSTYDDPHHYATGFSNVIVNGVPVIRNGALTGERPGQPVRRP